MLPDMSATMASWSRPYTVKTVTDITIDFEPENLVAVRTIQAVVQVAQKNKLNVESIDWSLRYLWIHTTDSLQNGEYIEFEGQDYKIIDNGDYQMYGYTEAVAEQTKRAALLETFILTYSASMGGTLTGDTSQVVSYGGDGTAVTAIPNTGFMFTTWSDGVITAARTDTGITANLTVSAIFAVSQFTLTYNALGGGTITGDAVQTVQIGNNGTEVSAVPNVGYKFTTWSDGVLTAARTDTNVTADLTVSASFAQLTWSLVGTGLSIATTGQPALAALNSTDVAFIDATNRQLRTYRWNAGAGTWSLVGTGLTITNTATPALAALNSTDVAFIDSTNDQLRTYRWNDGTGTWSLVGTGLTIPNTAVPALTALNSTDVAFIDSTNDQLRTYRWNAGTGTWSLVGTGLTITTVGAPALAALNSTDVALVDSQNNQLRTYRWNAGTGTWSLIGVGLIIGGFGAPALATLNSTDVAYIDTSIDQLRCYRFDGSLWSQIGTGTSIPIAANVALTGVNGTDIAFIDSTNDQLRTYRFG